MKNWFTDTRYRSSSVDMTPRAKRTLASINPIQSPKGIRTRATNTYHYSQSPRANRTGSLFSPQLDMSKTSHRRE